jgi:hypothetical protein
MIKFVLAVLGLGLLWLLSCLADRKRRAAFAAKFPPMSDAKFVEQCGPGISPTVALKVRGNLSDALGVDYERIYPSSRLVEDLGAE